MAVVGGLVAAFVDSSSFISSLLFEEGLLAAGKQGAPGVFAAVLRNKASISSINHHDNWGTPVLNFFCYLTRSKKAFAASRLKSTGNL